MASINQCLLLLAALLSLVAAFWRMPCANYPGTVRLDPIVSPCELSSHAHTIYGGSGFSWNANHSGLTNSACTSCGVSQDNSAYWAPPLVFIHTNGTSEAVPQVGGNLAYYLLHGQNISAFPPGFRMIAGNSTLRTFPWPIPDVPQSLLSGNLTWQRALRQRALGFNCLNYNAPGEGSLTRHFLPSKEFMDANCTDGLRLELLFPSCWNGVDVDSPDHKSHVAYASIVMDDGTCPEGFEARIPTLFYETIFNTFAFQNTSGQFVLANGDPTGFGYHGDFISGWDASLLQAAINNCTNLSGEISDCPLFDVTNNGDGNYACDTFDTPLPQAAVEENCSGPHQGLCGNVSIVGDPVSSTSVTRRRSQ